MLKVTVLFLLYFSVVFTEPAEYINVKNVELTAGSAVNVTVGPEDAVYCRVEDNKDNAVFDGFGPCKIVLDRVTKYHEGVWRIQFSVPGEIVLQNRSFLVLVQAADAKPVVRTSVVRDDPSVVLRCSVPIEYEVQACKFRGPHVNILFTNHEMKQGVYSAFLITYESDHECSLFVSKPSSWDEGIWRCAVDTTQGTYYGFLTLNRGSYEREPLLKPKNVQSIAGDAVTMSCSIDTAIRYCYFRASNGTVFNFGPSTLLAGYKYVGSGFDAGECGIRFDSFGASDGGAWSCHVGLPDSTAEELRASFTVLVEERMSLTHEWHGSTMSLHLALADKPKLDYCRFVRSDGRGFTTENVPSGYLAEPHWLKYGSCILNISEPNQLDVYPWTVAAKVPGVDGEMFMTSSSTLALALSVKNTLHSILMWIFYTVLSIFLILAAVFILIKLNRKLTYERAAELKNSFRGQNHPLQHTDVIRDLPPKKE